MDMKRIAKDALILFAITLIAGLALGFTNTLTEPIITKQNQEAAWATYREVFPAAASFEEDEDMAKNVELSAPAITAQGFGDAHVDSYLKALDAEGKVLGYVVTATCGEGYGGDITISVGIDKENGKVTGLGFLTINETAGLGMKAKEPAFKDQFAGKKATVLEVVKTGTATDEQVQAISGATKTSKATTNALNAAIYFVMNCLA